MKYRFVLGIGRSGTTLLARLLSFSSSPLKFVLEPLPRVGVFPNNNFVEPWFVPPDPTSMPYRWAHDQIVALASNNDHIRSNIINETVERDDPAARFLLIKEVHGLLAFPMITADLDAKTIVITRDTMRTIDSYFRGHPKKQRKYLVDEHQYLKQYISSGLSGHSDTLLKTAVSRTSPKVIKYLRRPQWLTNELLRQVCVTDFIAHFLRVWSQIDDRVYHVSFEQLCRDPVGVTCEAFDFMDLQYDHKTIAKIKKMTTGDSSDYYATDKNSRQILEQGYRYLSDKQVRTIRELIA